MKLRMGTLVLAFACSGPSSPGDAGTGGGSASGGGAATGGGSAAGGGSATGGGSASGGGSSLPDGGPPPMFVSGAIVRQFTTTTTTEVPVTVTPASPPMVTNAERLMVVEAVTPAGSAKSVSLTLHSPQSFSFDMQYEGADAGTEYWSFLFPSTANVNTPVTYSVDVDDLYGHTFTNPDAGHLYTYLQ